MDDLFADGRVIDCILFLMFIEGLALVYLSRKFRRPIPPAEITLNLGAGAALLTALRAEILHAGWPVVAAWLGVALAAHVFEVSLRWVAPR